METIRSPRPNWWGRNWKWFAPTGCLAILFAIAVFVTAITWMAFATVKANGAYKIALSAAQGDRNVIAELGEPVKPGMFPSGSSDENGASGHANLSIPVSGPKATGMIYVTATKSAGRWQFSELILQVADTKKRVPITPPR